MMMREEIFVTETVLPPREVYDKYIDDIFSSRRLTNQGIYVTGLEERLRELLHVPHVDLCGNGTLALQLGIRALGLQGKKVITTPFTYVATLSSLLWENCKPIFADIDPDTFCLDPEKVETCLRANPDAAGIMPVHVYGNACDVEAFAQLGRQHGCGIIYDGAHAFGSAYMGRSLLSYGDLSICSFHATKLFHTVEGGCVITRDGKDHDRIKLLRAFGHIGDEHYSLGINAKLSEMHAAMGLALLPEVPEILRKRARHAAMYDGLLDIRANANLRGITLRQGLEWNHAYYPVVFKTPELRAKVMEALERERIHPRRYFYPALTKLPYIHNQSCPVAENISETVLCLPIWPDMATNIIEDVCAVINKTVCGV